MTFEIKIVVELPCFLLYRGSTDAMARNIKYVIDFIDVFLGRNYIYERLKSML